MRKKHFHIPKKAMISIIVIWVLICINLIVTYIIKPEKNTSVEMKTEQPFETVSLSPLEQYLYDKDVKQYNNINADGCYVIVNGTKYHTGLCPIIFSSETVVVEIGQEEAELQGYIACDKCH